MAAKGVSTLKFVGVCTLGLYTGLSWTLSTIALPTLLALPSASTASRAFTNLTTLSKTHLQSLAGISSASFVLAYLFSPRSQKHPYLLWTTLFIGSASFSDYILSRTSQPRSSSDASAARQKQKKAKGKGRKMDASYEVVGASDRESEVSGEELDDEDINGEEVREQMKGFTLSQRVRTAVAFIGLSMSVIGIWGDGAVETVIIEL